MFQLIFMQFNSVRQVYLSQGALARIAILGDENDFIRYPLIGGGSVLLRENIVNNRKFIDFNSLAFSKSIAIAVDENVRD